MAGVWNIEVMDAVDEYKSFSHSLTYTDPDFPSVSYTVVLTPTETQPTTIYISGNNITGYYTDVFNMFVKYKTKSMPPEYITVKNFRAIDLDKLEQVVEYSPDLTPSKTYTYNANVYDGNTLVTTRVYTKVVNNNWDLNKALLKQYINSTVALDPTTFKPWINSINAATVKWRNTNNVDVNWTT